jgi:serine/threonine protein kinase
VQPLFHLSASAKEDEMQPSAPFDSTIPNPEQPDSIGPFRVLRPLGAGGMGSVYLCERMEQFTQQVAIKVLHPHLFPAAADARLEHEGRMLAALEHPGVVRLLDLSATVDGLRYVVMDYVDGMPIDLYCDQHRLPINSRISILLDVCEAVEHAHRHFVVHSDLKPENILVTVEGKPRLLDFGVATILSGLGASQPHPSASEGEYTALYASPEQRSGDRLTVASDVYSLGLIAQSVLTGLQPQPLPIGVLHSNSPIAASAGASKRLRDLDHGSIERIAAARVTPPSALLAALQGDLGAILSKALHLDPKERFQSAQELHDELKRTLHGYPIQTRPAGWTVRTWKWMLRNRLAASLGCVLLLVVLFSILGVIRQSIEAARKRQIAQTRLHELVRLTDLLAGDLYESVHGLQGSESAQAALLTSAHQTIDKLAGDDDRDIQLDFELAREYEKLARLELSHAPLTPEAARQSAADLEKEAALLDRLDQLDKGNPETARLRRQLPETTQLRNAALQRR